MEKGEPRTLAVQFREMLMHRTCFRVGCIQSDSCCPRCTDLASNPTISNMAQHGFMKPDEDAPCRARFSQSYVDTSARESYRCDREIMYMLDMLMRPYPRRQILVTEDVNLAREANTVCHVRSAKWLNEELLKSGPAGVNASEALMSIEYDFQPIMEELPKAVQIAFAAR
ncbi:unnamed protein product [Symbiodinium sp. CCMP2592]|nr:unnamed protein product [Symbiodinium sp. CCMP2592]